MPLPAILPTALVETILTHLATLFLTGANNDPVAARDAASHMLASYRPATADQLRLAANIVMFSLQALEALSQAAAPNTPITRILRLRSGAASLSRQAAQAERRLAQLQELPPQPIGAPPPAPETIQPIPATATAKPQTWTQAYDQRQTDLRIAASLKRAEALVAAKSPPPPQAVFTG